MAITECQGHKIVDHEHNNSLLHLNLVSRPIPPCSALYPFYEYRTLDSRMAFCSIYPLARGSPARIMSRSAAYEENIHGTLNFRF